MFKPEKFWTLQTTINCIKIDFEAIFSFLEFIEIFPLVFVAFSFFFRICSQFTFLWLTYKSEASNSSNNKKPFKNNIVRLYINWKQTSNRLTEYMNREKNNRQRIVYAWIFIYCICFLCSHAFGRHISYRWFSTKFCEKSSFSFELNEEKVDFSLQMPH